MLFQSLLLYINIKSINREVDSKQFGEALNLEIKYKKLKSYFNFF